MAIRPEISLQAGKIPQDTGIVGGIERGMKLQQLAMQPAILEQQLATARQAEQTSRAAQMTSEAQLPGVRAQAAGLVRGERQANERIAAAQAAIEVDDKGSPIMDPVTGQPKFNLPKYQYGLHRAGLVDEALKTGSEALKQSKDAYEFTTSVRNQIAIAAQAAYDTTVGTPAQKQKAAEATWKDLSGRAIQASASGNFPMQESQFNYTPGLEKALYKAAINPATQESLKQGLSGQDIQRDQLTLQTDQFENSKKLNFTDDASMDPNSGVSQRARAIIEQGTGIKLPPEMSAGEIYRNPQYKQAMESIGGNVGVARNAALADVTKWESVSKAIDRAKAKLSARGITPIQLIENAVNLKVFDDPELAALYGVLSQLKPNEIPRGAGFESLKLYSDAMGSHAKANAGVAVGGGAIERTEAPKPTTPQAPAAPAPSRSVTKAQVEGFAKETGKTVAQVTKDLRDRGVEIK